MSLWNRRLSRIAVRLQNAFQNAETGSRLFVLPSSTWSDAETSLRRWKTARDRNWLRAAERERVAFTSELESLERQLRHLTADLKNERAAIVPSLRLLVEELAATEAEFGELVWEEGEVGVTTESIVLDDIELGPFQIRLQLDRIGTDAPYRIRALEPNPAASCIDTTHPHVSGERLCSGEGRGAIAAALAEGRLFDFFTIVDRILHTYAVGSAYVELDQWHGVSCHDCDSSIDESDACTCNRCEERICGDCLCCCNGCGDGYCSGCLDRCQRCEEPTCVGCLVRCEDCRQYVCPSCREDELCETCRKQREEQEDEEESPAEESAPLSPPAQSTV
jgi:hypothetical protein